MEKTNVPTWAVGAAVACVLLLIVGLGFMVFGPKAAPPVNAAEFRSTQSAERPGDAPSGQTAPAADATQRAD
jgi:hypothetical protein